MHNVPVIRVVCDFLLLLLVWLPMPIFYKSVQPFTRGIFCNDQSIRYPKKEGTISQEVLYSVGTLLPTLSIGAVEAYRTYVLEPKMFRGGEELKPRYTLMGRPIPPVLTSLYVYLGYFYFGMAFNFCLTDLGKYTIGRLRPHFIDVCKPDWTKLNCSFDPDAYRPDAFCTEEAKVVRKARVSFPSGHSSFSFYAMTYLILYLHSRMVWPIGGLLTKHVLQFVAFVLAFETALSRVSDNKHHWTDVTAGAVLGIAMATITACCMAGFFRRPQSIFARPGPYDTQSYTGAQLFPIVDDASESKASVIVKGEHIKMEE